MDMRKLTSHVGRLFRRAGFSGKGQTWWFDGDDVLVVANLQKDRYGSVVYLNLGFWLKSLGPPPSPPKKHLCPVGIRAEDVFPDSLDEIDKLLDLARSIPEEERYLGLEKLLDNVIIPFLKDASSASRLRAHMLRGRFDHGLVTVAAKEALDIPRS